MTGITADEARALTKKELEDLLHDEQSLNIKLIKLVEFNSSEYFEYLSDKNKDLFKRQEKAMVEYSLALRERIEA